MAGETSKSSEIKVDVAEVETNPVPPRRCNPHVPAEAEPVVCIYKECRHNHAATFGRYAFDGCGEFMSCTDDAYVCAACNCHRSFHRKEPPTLTPNNNNTNNDNNNTNRNNKKKKKKKKINYNDVVLALPAQRKPPQKPLNMAPMPLASHNGRTGDTSLFPKVDRKIDAGYETLRGTAVRLREGKETKKRSKRTKLTMDQKDKMSKFARKLGWRPQRHDEDELLQFCEEIGITKRVFGIWLNNNRRRKPGDDESEE